MNRRRGGTASSSATTQPDRGPPSVPTGCGVALPGCPAAFAGCSSVPWFHATDAFRGSKSVLPVDRDEREGLKLVRNRPSAAGVLPAVQGLSIQRLRLVDRTASP